VFVQRKRYVKRRSSRRSIEYPASCLHRIAVRLFTIGAVIAVVTSLIGLFAISGLFGAGVGTGKFVDPELYSMLKSGSAIAYLSYTGDLDLSRVQVLKTWIFGDLRVSKIVIPNVSVLDRLKNQAVC